MKRTLPDAGAAFAEARRLHSEAFLRYKTLDPKRTDGVARAMADQDVDLVQAEVDWVIAREDMALKRTNLLLHLVLEMSDAVEPAERTN